MNAGNDIQTVVTQLYTRQKCLRTNKQHHITSHQSMCHIIIRSAVSFGCPVDWRRRDHQPCPTSPQWTCSSYRSHPPPRRPRTSRHRPRRDCRSRHRGRGHGTLRRPLSVAESQQPPPRLGRVHGTASRHGSRGTSPP